MLQIQNAPWVHYDRKRAVIACDHCHQTRTHGRSAGLAKLQERLRAFAREHQHAQAVRA